MRRRFTSRRSSTSRSPRRKVISLRENVTSLSQVAGSAGLVTTDALASFETLYGAQLIGATILGIRGRIATYSNTSVVSQYTTYMGFIVEKLERADIVSGHPDPGAASNDRMAAWMAWTTVPGHFAATPPAGLSPFQWTSFSWRGRRNITNLEDTLILAYGHNAPAGTINVNINYEAYVALP